MIVIGIDLHKRTHTATTVDPVSNTDLGSIRIESTLAHYKRVIAWAKPWPARRWAVENAESLGRHLTRWRSLVASRHRRADHRDRVDRSPSTIIPML
ncbi:hypothetical protein ACFWBG_24615 [Nocardia salmonicida]|uniref:hypothetical protein n=1 Tax=Nocardia salmonicida TaxID=53431 RepID=UPI003670F0A8